MTINNIKETINAGGYICWTEGQRPALYDDQHKFLHYVPAATAQRIAQDRDFTKWAERWGGYYIARRLGKKAMQHENDRHCERIARDLESYAAGNVYRCPDCDAILELPDDVGDKYRCPDCGTVHEIDELEQLSLWDYFDETYDIKYLIDSDCKTVNSVKICVACGGPNIYIDTESRAVELYWWGDRASYPIGCDVCDEIDTWAQELFGYH